MDLISQLPESIIHDILSYLPIRDSARTCVLSKTWRQFHATKPIMVFNHFEFDPQVYGNWHTSWKRRQLLLTSSYSRKKELFMNYVESSLNCFFNYQQQQPSSPLRKFDLTCCVYDDQFEQDFGRIDQWLHDVIHNGTRSLCLHIISYKNHTYPLPHCVLASQMLKELCLSGTLLLDACKNITISLPSLRVLSLCNILNVSDDLVKHLLIGCPFVEILRIQECSNLVDLQVSSLARLVELSLDSCIFVRSIEVGSINFRSFSYSRNKTESNIELLGASETLRKLKMEICDLEPQSPFHQLYTFIHLEELVLEYVDAGRVPKVRISSQSLKRLVIRSLLNMKEVVEIECPNLIAMQYTSNLLPFHFISPLNPTHFRLEFNLDILWLDALKILFEKCFSTTQYPKVFIFLKDHQEVIIMDLDDGLIQAMLTFLSRVEDLESTSRIIIASNFVNLKDEILTPMPPHMAFNIVSSCTSNFTQIFSERLSRMIESCGCIAEKDSTTVNISSELRQFLSSTYQITRIVSKWDWAT